MKKRPRKGKKKEKRLTILVAAGDAALASDIRQILEKEIPQSDILIVHDGESAVDKLDANPHLVILDLNLPKLRGEGVMLANELKGINAPVLVISSESRPDVEFMGDVNVMATLQKPFRQDDLIQAIRAGAAGMGYDG